MVNPRFDMDTPHNDREQIETEEIILTSIHDILVVVKAWSEADAKKDSTLEGRVHMVDFCLSQIERLMLPVPDQLN